MVVGIGGVVPSDATNPYALISHLRRHLSHSVEIKVYRIAGEYG
jgi:hypothetical protein